MKIEARFRLERAGFVLDTDFTAPIQGITALFGPSGSGKTTLLRVIAGLERCPNGLLRLGGETWQDGTRFVPPHKRPIAYVFQEANLFPHLSVADNLKYGYRRIPQSEQRLDFEDVVELLALMPLLARTTLSLSGGERQRVAIGRALLVSPRLLLLDEPLAALDRESKEGILPYLESVHEQLALPAIYVSHDVDEVARIADHMLLMETGRIVADGSIAQLLARLDLPLAHGDTAESVIETTVCDHDPQFHLIGLAFAGTTLWVPHEKLPMGKRLRLRVLARDISLAPQPPTLSSILNIIPTTVDTIHEEGPAHAMVRLRAGEGILLARITRRSAAHLRLQPGSPIYAQVKSVAVLD